MTGLETGALGAMLQGGQPIVIAIAGSLVVAEPSEPEYVWVEDARI